MLNSPIKKFLLALAILFCATGVEAQTYFRLEGNVNTPLGAAVPGASVAICSQPAVITGQPCSPLVSLFAAPTSNTVTLTGASYAAQQIIFALNSAPPDVIAGSYISITGANPSTFNGIWLISSVSGLNVTIANVFTNPGTYSSGGTVATSALPNPLVTDGNGYYFGYALIAAYTIQVYSPTIFTQVYADQYPNSPGNGGGGGGSVTSFTVNPSGSIGPFFTATVSSPTTTPVLNLTPTTQSANCFLAGPASGGPLVPTCRAIVAADLLPINLASSANGGVSGNLPIANNCPASPPGSPSTMFLRGDCTWSTPSGSGTVNAGTAGQLAGYVTSTNAVSGLPSFNWFAGGSSAQLTIGIAGTSSGVLFLTTSAFGGGAGTALLASNTSTGLSVTLPSATGVLIGNGGANTGASTMTLDLSALTGANAFKVPAFAGAQATANGALNEDTSTKMYHFNLNSVDSFIAGFPTSLGPTNGHCAEWIVSGSNITLGDTVCGGGSGTINNSAQFSDPIYSAAGTTNTISGNGPPTINGIWVPSYNVTAGVAVAKANLQAGLGPRSIIGATTADTVAFSDNLLAITHIFAATGTVGQTLPTATTLGNPNFVYSYCNDSPQTDTITPTTWTIQAGSTAAGAALTVPPGICYRIHVDGSSATNWLADKSSATSGGTVTHSVGGLSLGQPVFGNAAADVQTVPVSVEASIQAATTDDCALIAEGWTAANSANSQGGTVTATFGGSPPCAASPFTGAPSGSGFSGLLKLGNANFLAATSWAIPNHYGLLCDSNHGGASPASTTLGCSVQAANTFPTSTPLIAMGNASPSFAVNIGGGLLTCEDPAGAAIAGCIVIQNTQCQENCSIHDVFLEGGDAEALDIEGTANDTGTIRNVAIGFQGVNNANALAIKCGTAATLTIPNTLFTDISINGQLDAVEPNIGSSWDCANVTFIGGHTEQTVVAHEIGANRLAHGLVFSGNEFSSTAGKPMTTGYDIASAHGTDSLVILGAYAVPGNITNMLVDHMTNGGTIVESVENEIALYVRGPANYVFTSSAQIPDHFQAKLEDFSAATWKIPTAAGFTSSASSMGGYDSTVKNTHQLTNGADSLSVAEATAVTANLIPKSGSSTLSTLVASSIADNGTTVTTTEPVNALAYQTATNCAAVGTSANPSLVACGSASAGAFSCATTASAGTCVVSDTAVTANSEIIVQEVSYVGSRLSVTCNTGNILPTGSLVTSISAGTSFTVTLGTVAVNPACFIYTITN